MAGSGRTKVASRVAGLLRFLQTTEVGGREGARERELDLEKKNDQAGEDLLGYVARWIRIMALAGVLVLVVFCPHHFTVDPFQKHTLITITRSSPFHQQTHPHN